MSACSSLTRWHRQPCRRRGCRVDPRRANTEGKTSIVLDGAQLSLQIHESVGHPIELDRVYGEEIGC